MLFEQWRDRFGWIIGALLIMTVVAIMIVQYQYRAARPPRIFSLVGLAVGISIGGLLFLPAVPRIVTALWQLVITQAPMDTSGPFPLRPLMSRSPPLQVTLRSLSKFGIPRRVSLRR